MDSQLGASSDSDSYTIMIEKGINEEVAQELNKICQAGKLSFDELDERALEALKELNAEDSVGVLQQFANNTLEHVTNKSAFLCSQIKSYKQGKITGQGESEKPGPDKDKLQEILDRTGYSLDVTTGQRKYGGPPPDFTGPAPETGCEVFIGRIPKDVFEDELIPLMEKCGTIWDLRLMMDQHTQMSRGYAFVTFTTKEAATKAMEDYNDFEIKPYKKIKVNKSIANVRLFIGNIPKTKTKDNIREEFSKFSDGLTDVIIYKIADDPTKKNRGFCFLEYDTHKNASNARRKFASGRICPWKCDIIVDWADPLEQPDEETMSKVKVLYVSNLTSDVSEDDLRQVFEEYGQVERVRKLRDYAFIHFDTRESTENALQATQGKKIGRNEINVTLAKPPMDTKKKDQRKHNRERRQWEMRGGYGAYGGYAAYSGYTYPMMRGSYEYPMYDYSYSGYYDFNQRPDYGELAGYSDRGRGYYKQGRGTASAYSQGRGRGSGYYSGTIAPGYDRGGMRGGRSWGYGGARGGRGGGFSPGSSGSSSTGFAGQPSPQQQLPQGNMTSFGGPGAIRNRLYYPGQMQYYDQTSQF